MTRENKLQNLRNQFKELAKYENFIGTVDKPAGHLTQCNFGGLLIIFAASGDGALVWSDWAGEAVSDTLTEVEIEYKDNEDTGGVDAGFSYNGSFYFLGEFMTCNA